MRTIVGRRWTWAHACAALSVVASATGGGTCGWAQAPPDPAANLWTRPTLSGDWGGLRSQLDRNGVPGGGVLNSDGSIRPNAWVIAIHSSLNF